MGRKYLTYKVVVTQDKSIFINEAENTNSYLETKDLYSKIKEVNQNEDCLIEFIGITPDGTEGILFSKEYKQEIIENERLIKTTDDIVIEIKDLLENLQEKRAYCQDMEGAITKKQDIILHKIENLRVLDVANEEEMTKIKVSIIDELFDVRTERRKIKDEKSKLDYVYSKCDISDFSQKINSVKIPIPNNEKKAIKYNKDLDNEVIFKEIKYSTSKQRNLWISQMEHKYTRIVDDAINKKLVCYKNKAKVN